jgi:hypothetical protein
MTKKMNKKQKILSTIGDLRIAYEYINELIGVSYDDSPESLYIDWRLEDIKNAIRHLKSEIMDRNNIEELEAVDKDEQ